MIGRRKSDSGTWIHPNARELLSEVFADEHDPYVEPPDIPPGMTMAEYRRERWSKLSAA